MEYLIYICPVILIFYIIYIFTKYDGTEAYEKVHIEYYRDKDFTEYSPLVWSYIINRKFKKDTIIATILMYVKKGYISMTKKDDDYEFKLLKPLDDVNPLDKWGIKMFFKDRINIGNIQYLNNFNRYFWIEKTFGKFNEFQKDADSVIRAFLKQDNIIDYANEKMNKKNIIISYIAIIFSLICVMFSSSDIINYFGLSIFFITGYSLLVRIIENSEFTLLTHGVIFFASYFAIGNDNKYNMVLFITAMLTFLLIYVDNNIIRVKGKNGEVVEKALGLKRYIKDFSNIKEYSLEYLNLWDEYYIYSIALGMNKVIK